MIRLRPTLLLLLLAGLCGPAGDTVRPAAAEEPGPRSRPAERDAPRVDAPALAAELDGLIRQLDADRFDQRQQAAARLEQLAARPELARTLAETFQRLLVSPTTPFEVRLRIERLRSRLPKSVSPAAEQAAAGEIDLLIRQTEDDNYASRLGASRRLQWLLTNPKLVCPIMLKLKSRLAGERLTVDQRQWLEPTYRRAHGAWLLEGNDDGLPEISDEQIARWVDELAAWNAAGQRAREIADQGLRDAMARDKYLPKVKAAVRTVFQAGGHEPQAAQRLKALLDLCRPAIVAEYWSNRRHGGVQRLYIGEPRLELGADKPSHFDRIDDETAHCVSGQNLATGDHPVGVAIPHPDARYPRAFFHLVNLSTPRRQMAYAYQLTQDESRRLAGISRKTLDRYLARKRPLSLAELDLLDQLDASEVSRFAGPMFAAVDDRPISEDESRRRALAAYPAMDISEELREAPRPRPTHHGTICQVLAELGTREAIPGLLQAIRAERISRSTERAPYDLAWIAALAITARDPWPESEAWLAELVGRGDKLVKSGFDAPQLGATAAALLLSRAGRDPGAFGLLPAHDPWFLNVGLAGYRYGAPDAHRKVQQWCNDRKAPGAAGAE